MAAGADAIGLVFEPKSPRCVTIEQAAAIAAAMAPFVAVVGLFVDADAARVCEAIKRVRLHLLQFHGSETPDQCRSYDLPYIKAIRMHPDVDLLLQARAYDAAAALLLDAYDPAAAGGTGHTFDWSRIPRDMNKRIVLAGGLTPQNVAAAIQQVHPYAVDVSSGVEKTKGIKDADKIRAFVRAVGEAA